MAFILAVNSGQVPNKYSLPGEKRWCLTFDLEERFPQYPYKVLRAKCARLVKRGLLDGCTCGCRGDFYVIGGPLDYY